VTLLLMRLKLELTPQPPLLTMATKADWSGTMQWRPLGWFASKPPIKPPRLFCV